MLTATLRWRDEMKVDDIMAEKFPDDVFSGVGRIFGHDKEGRPVVYVLIAICHSPPLTRWNGQL